MSPQVIILLGKPGSGKGTQARLLCEKLGFDYVGSGDILRKRKLKKDFFGKKIASYIDKGKRVPTIVISALWMEKFLKLKEKKDLKGIVIDGSPRTKKEAELLEEAFDWFEWRNKKVFLIDISSKTAISRLSSRKICQKCGRIYPNPPPEEKFCRKCQGKLVQREDDTYQGIKERLRWYQKEVKVAINFYQKKKELIKIDGEKSVEEVFKEILSHL